MKGSISIIIGLGIAGLLGLVAVDSTNSDIVDPGDTAEDFHVYDVEEPYPLMAIVCQDNDFDCQYADPNLHTEVELPSCVRDALYQLTVAEYQKQIYEGPTPLSSVIGKVYRLTIPGDDRRYLYAYHLDLMPLYRGFSAVLLVHDTLTDTISSEPISIPIGNCQEYCPRPWIYFQDIDGDGNYEIIVLSGRHFGTECNDITLYGLSVEKDLSLRPRLEILTGIYAGRAFPGDRWEDRYGYVVRSIESGTSGTVNITVSLSRKNLEFGERILGFETYEIDSSGQYAKTEYQIVEEKYGHLFFPRE
jgi:hypothetical protein